MRNGWREALLDAVALVLPVECVGCGAPDRELCRRCRAGLRPEPIRRLAADGLPVWSGFEYDGVVRAALLAAKERGRTGLLRPLAPGLAAAVDAAGIHPAGGSAAGPGRGVLVCPVPSSGAARRRRGFDPVTVLAAAAGLPVHPLLAARGGAAQKTLGIEERALNRRGAFVASPGVRGRRVLLVDDVVTTGATLAAAAAAVRAAGGEVVAAATAASTPRRHGRPSTLSADAPAGARDFPTRRD
jgi:predicted amidophosphoribosyltransferase